MCPVSRNTPPIVFVQEAVNDTAAYLAMWDAKLPLPQPDAPARAAAIQAVDRIDRALILLIQIRSQLIAEIAIEDKAWLALDDDNPVEDDPYDPRD